MASATSGMASVAAVTMTIAVITPAAYPPRPAPGGAPIRPWHGPTPPARFGPARFGPARFGPARFGPARFGPARFGPARFGPARFGPAGAVRSGAVGRQRSSTAAAHSSALVQAERFGPAPARPARWGLGAALGRSRRWRDRVVM